MTAKKVDVLLVGGGVMSATLGMLLKQLDPEMRIVLVERLDHVAHESTDGWNNAGTGHAGYCELNYTPQADDGSIAIDRALAINASFEVTLQFWSSLVEQNILPSPKKFINPTPHLSFVWGEKDVEFLRQRHQLLSQHHLFKDMVFSDSADQLAEWMPLVMQNRNDGKPVAATRVAYGSDVDFGSLTRSMISWLQEQPNFDLHLKHSVTTLRKSRKGFWRVEVEDENSGEEKKFEADFVFLGAGGGSLPLLQKSNIDESRGYGGFPVSGQWLVCQQEDVVKQHRSKVYGKAPVGAPPMSVPHLDTRIINGKPALLFGPFAGFTTKFLKQGSFFDLFSSVKRYNVKPMLGVGRDNMDLTRYLIGESFQSHKDRVASLRNYFPEAREENWRLQDAGMRVQIIKKNAQGHGKLEFGTEIVAAKDGTLAALLGASPGASTAVQAMIDVLERCFSDRLQSSEWQSRIRDLIPSYGQSLVKDGALLDEVRERTLRTLQLQRD
ncbi:malate dehydrogenase (quinone) [Halopseudomonas salegens]|uniref:Probable malate:quinone oxidoreductase n=1 Tax=Halopseudomonas salegens TaxID=1434072 RepID=A0A1H2EFE8_9GAMM|nr:malate dehydrogenase (quinone) [Halopseudomonas salegens]SDT93865.1 malate dehydrogenase (quinone) [Halopseudomonas salegens]